MIKIFSVFILISLTGCVAHTNNYNALYTSYGQVTTTDIIVAPSYIKNQDGSIEYSPTGTIYSGRTSPQPVYLVPYNRYDVQPKYNPSVPQIKR